MITLRRSQERGHADHGWLRTYHTFSFADYHDPDFMGFSALRVINQDFVQAGKGFPRHGHRDMEIITYVISGALEHQDSMGNGSSIVPGDVQLMSAGTGVEHSERNPSPDESLHLLQMWVLPTRNGTEPRYEQRSFPLAERTGRLQLVVSPDGAEGSLTIGQDARLYASLLDPGTEARYAIEEGRCAWLHLARGSIELQGREMGPGDGAAIRDERGIWIVCHEPAELVLWDLPEEG